MSAFNLEPINLSKEERRITSETEKQPWMMGGWELKYLEEQMYLVGHVKLYVMIGEQNQAHGRGN